MSCGSGIGSEPTGRSPVALQAAARGSVLVLLVVLLTAGCSGGQESGPEKTVLATRKGGNFIQVTEAEENGNQVVRVKTVFRGEENVIELNIDQPVYEVEIPLSLEQVMPQAAAARGRSPQGQFEDLLIAQYLGKAQQLMMAGDYNGALRQVDLVLLIKPDHIRAHEMKGSVYYALGNYQLANEEWEYVLAQDPSNKEVNDFMQFLKNRQGVPQPPLPGASRGKGGTSPKTKKKTEPGAQPKPSDKPGDQQ